MSKKEEKSAATKAGEGIGVVLAVVVFLGAVILAILPFYFIVSWVKSKGQVKEILSKNAGSKDYWLTPSERERYKTLNKKGLEAKRDKENAISIADKEGITKNQDGKYSTRSKAGKEARSIIEGSDEIYSNAAREMRLLRQKPRSEWEVADKCFRSADASKLGFLAFVVALPFCMVAMSVIKGYPWNEGVNFIVWWCVASLVGGLFSLPPRFLKKSSSQKFFEEPPEVCLSNIDVWGNSEKESLDSEVVSEGQSVEKTPVKPRMAYVLLGIFLGMFGIHNFYAGYIARAVSQLLITLLLGWLVIPLFAVAIWVLVEVCSVSQDAQGNPFL